MKMTSRRHVLGSMAGAAMLSPVSVFAQQAAPDPVRVVMPFPPGNPFDATIRKTLEVVQRQRPGRTWIVDNKPGAAGIIGTAEVARAKPDGLTLLFTTGGHTTTAITHRKLPYDPERDFVPITRLTESAGFVLLVPANSPFRSVQELVAAAKEKPDTISYASAGVGNGTHLVGALFERAAGIKLIHTPYKALPIPDLIGGHVNMLFWGSGNSKQLVDEGKVRALAITGSRRWSDMPNLPALSEMGYQIEVGAWNGLFAPAGTPAATVEAIYRQIAQAFQDKELTDWVIRNGSTPAVSTPTEFKAYLRAEMERYKATIVPLGIVVE
jgi:tripartite-type tricarboxylate transporter receptor subunit TctC